MRVLRLWEKKNLKIKLEMPQKAICSRDTTKITSYTSAVLSEESADTMAVASTALLFKHQEVNKFLLLLLFVVAVTLFSKIVYHIS